MVFAYLEIEIDWIGHTLLAADGDRDPFDVDRIVLIARERLLSLAEYLLQQEPQKQAVAGLSLFDCLCYESLGLLRCELVTQLGAVRHARLSACSRSCSSLRHKLKKLKNIQLV